LISYIFPCGHIPAALKGPNLMNNPTTPNNSATPSVAPAKDTPATGVPIQPHKAAPADTQPKVQPAVVPTPKI
jgi:hypothetical protein